MVEPLRVQQDKDNEHVLILLYPEGDDAFIIVILHEIIIIIHG